MNKKQTFLILKYLRSTLFLFLLSAIVFSQSIAESQIFLQEVEEKKEQIKTNNRLSFAYYHILGYAAIRENDPTFCDNNTEKPAYYCQNAIREFLPLRSIAKQECEGLPPDIKAFCNNINDCDKQSRKSLKDMCYGFESGDISIIMQSRNAQDNGSDRNDHDWTTEEEVREELAIYNGFKHEKSQSACEKENSRFQGKRAYLCEVIFGNTPIDSIMDSVLTDLAYYLLSEKYFDKQLCNEIKNTNIKYGCLSSLSLKSYFNIPDFDFPE